MSRIRIRVTTGAAATLVAVMAMGVAGPAASAATSSEPTQKAILKKAILKSDPTQRAILRAILR